jgi:hypothetical protein
VRLLALAQQHPGTGGDLRPDFLAQLAHLVRAETSSTSCDQVIFVDQATDASLSSDAVLVWVGRCG